MQVSRQGMHVVEAAQQTFQLTAIAHEVHQCLLAIEQLRVAIDRRVHGDDDGSGVVFDQREVFAEPFHLCVHNLFVVVSLTQHPLLGTVIEILDVV